MSSDAAVSGLRFAAPEAALKGGAVAMTLLLPLFLFYGRGVADVLLSGVASLFLARSLLAADWRWTRRPWVWLAAALWLLTLVASIGTGVPHSALEALVLVRLPLFCAALEAWVLTGPRERRWLGWVVTALAGWLALECWQQYLFGRNVMGDLRWPDGALTGPFYKPRAGGSFLMVVFPGLIAVVLTQIRKDARGRLVGLALLLFAVLTMILIGQRMPSLLMLLGLAATALIVPRFRRLALLALVVAAVALAALPVISPPTYAKLVVKFTEQMSHFASSPYGQLYTRATVMTAAHPWLGLGFEGFRDGCSDPAYFHGLPALGIPDGDNGGVLGCNIHPHNYYLQVATSAGVPGLLLFVALVWLWLRQMARALSPSRDVAQAMLLVTACVIFWPFASTSSLFTLDTAGWVFLMTGWGLAASGASAAAGGV